MFFSLGILALEDIEQWPNDLTLLKYQIKQ